MSFRKAAVWLGGSYFFFVFLKDGTLVAVMDDGYKIVRKFTKSGRRLVRRTI